MVLYGLWWFYDGFIWVYDGFMMVLYGFMMVLWWFYDGCKMVYDCFLVGGAITILKNMKVNGKDYPIYDGK